MRMASNEGKGTVAYHTNCTTDLKSNKLRGADHVGGMGEERLLLGS